MKPGVSVVRGRGIWNRQSLLLTDDPLEPSAHDAGAEHAGGAGHHALCDRRAVLRAEPPGCPDNRVRGGAEPFNESPVIGRSVVGAFGESSGNRNWRYSNRANLGPEFVFLLHLLLHSPTRSQETAPYGPSATASQSAPGDATLRQACARSTRFHIDLPTGRRAIGLAPASMVGLSLPAPAGVPPAAQVRRDGTRQASGPLRTPARWPISTACPDRARRLRLSRWR